VVLDIVAATDDTVDVCPIGVYIDAIVVVVVRALCITAAATPSAITIMIATMIALVVTTVWIPYAL